MDSAYFGYFSGNGKFSTRGFPGFFLIGFFSNHIPLFPTILKSVLAVFHSQHVHIASTNHVFSISPTSPESKRIIGTFCMIHGVSDVTNWNHVTDSIELWCVMMWPPCLSTWR